MIRRTVLAVAVFVTAAQSAAGQCTAAGVSASCAQSSTMQITVQRTVRVTVTPSAANLGIPTAADYDAGFSQALGHTISILANTGWDLSIASTQGNWTNSGGRGNKPRADLLWSTNAAGPFTPITNIATSVVTGGATTSATVTLHYRIIWNWTLDTPATYSLPLLLRVAAP